MRANTARNLFPVQIAALALASVFSIPVAAQQQAQPSTGAQDTPPVAAQQQPTSAAKSNTPGREGFWGRANPMARKKWVKKQTDPINDRLSELDEVNAKNAKDIQDVDTRESGR